MLDMELALAAAAVLFVSSFTPAEQCGLHSIGGKRRFLARAAVVARRNVGFSGVDGICRFWFGRFVYYLARVALGGKNRRRRFFCCTWRKKRQKPAKTLQNWRSKGGIGLKRYYFNG